MSARGQKTQESQVISAELTAGLLLITAFRIIQRNIVSPEGQFPTALSGLTHSLACVWFASNVRFLLFKSNTSTALFAHSISRIVAFLALLGACCERCTIRGQEQLAGLDIMLLSLFVVSSLIVLALGHSLLEGSPKRVAIFTKPQRFFLQMDSFAALIFGALFLMCPEWLLSPGMTGRMTEENPQLLLTRAFGAMIVGDSFVSSTIQSQLDTTRTPVFSCRAVGTVVLLMFVLQNQLTAPACASSNVSFGLIAAGLWTGNSILGFVTSKEDHTVSVEEIYKLALQRKERVHLVHHGLTHSKA